MIRFFSKHFLGDRVIWAVIFTLFVVSMLVIYSATGTIAYRFRGGDTSWYVIRHVKFMLFGLGIIFFTHKIPYRYFSRLSLLMVVLAIILLLITLALGRSTNDATRWLTLPGGISFQTSDFAKVALLMYVARVLAHSQGSKVMLAKAFKEIMVAVVIICGLIVPENFSTSAMLFATVWVMMYIGRIEPKLLWGSVGILTGLMVLFILLMLVSNKQGRLGTWKNRIENFITDKDPDASYQSDQAKIAIVTGGLFGKGPGNSDQRNFLPHPYSDFIYAIIIEEYGLFGAAVTICLYLFLFYRTGRIVKTCNTTFPAFLAIGLSLSLVFQALINMAVAVNIFPVTGQPLPFVSMGGTSVLFTCMGFGMLLSVSRGVDPQFAKDNLD